MNYKKIYDSLIERGSNRKLECYKESHHILPRCIGGTDEKDNLVELTPEEHYLAHQLLVKIYPDEAKLVYAANMMIPNRSSNKMYGWLRRRFSKEISINQKGKGNSQANTFWVSNINERKNLKLKKGDDIPLNYLPGRNLWKELDRQYELERNKEIKLQNNIDKAKKYYLLFCDSNYNSLKSFGESNMYPHSYISLYKLWKKYLPEYNEISGQGKSIKKIMGCSSEAEQ